MSSPGIESVDLKNERLHLRWSRHREGWQLTELKVRSGAEWITHPRPSGRHTVLFIDREPAANLSEVNKEGKAFPFYPEKMERRPDGALLFTKELSIGKVVSEWRLDTEYPSDLRVKMHLSASKKGRFSLATPTLAVCEREDIRWGMVPGNWYGNSVQDNDELSPDYSQGIPNRSFIANERNTMTLCPLLSAKDGIVMAVIPDPGMADDPWAFDANTRSAPSLGLSTMDRYGDLTPVLYRPLLTSEKAKLDIGQTALLHFRVTITTEPWFSVFTHAAMNIYRFPELLSLQSSRESLSDRVARLQAMLRSDTLSGWNTQTMHEVTLGSNGTKTSDVAAMWMMARTGDDALLKARLPFIRNYKLLQQQMSGGFFQHAATGEYPSEHGFTAERGNWIEPLFTSYYTLQDMGNIVLFDTDDGELKARMRLAAEKLLAWQHEDGSFEVAYDSVSHRSAFPHLKDLRPTWYGLYVAWRTLADARYLAAARRGADWYLENAVTQGHYLGACGDALNIWDFTTVFGAQAMLDMYGATGDERYRLAAIEIAKVYATTIFTHPIATDREKRVAGITRRDWEISQVGLSVEHIRGTANGGPITLSSHAGFFVRMYELTREKIFLDMARAAARGRHHFVNPDTGLSVYYWDSIDRVVRDSTLFPWHAEWQVGWITDYLISEAHLRSGGEISFPAGFITPKVGSHLTYGFRPGIVYGHEAALWMSGGAVTTDDPNTEHLSAVRTDQSELLIVVLNQSPEAKSAHINIDVTRSPYNMKINPDQGSRTCELSPWGMTVIAIPVQGKRRA